MERGPLGPRARTAPGSAACHQPAPRRSGGLSEHPPQHQAAALSSNSLARFIRNHLAEIMHAVVQSPVATQLIRITYLRRTCDGALARGQRQPTVAGPRDALVRTVRLAATWPLRSPFAYGILPYHKLHTTKCHQRYRIHHGPAASCDGATHGRSMCFSLVRMLAQTKLQ